MEDSGKVRKIFSIILASNRPENFSAFLDNLEQTCDSPKSFEVLVKVDSEDQRMVDGVEAEIARRPFDIRCMVAPKGGGYYALHHAYQRLFMKFSDPGTYFASVFTDEIRFKTEGWDAKLANYVGLFKDDVFRLRISDFKVKNYYRMYESLPMPENYSITTRKWYELTGGLWEIMPGQKDAFWGVDSWHQCIEYYLGQCLDPTMVKGIYRGWPIDDIKIGGVEAGAGWEGAAAFDRARRVSKAWLATDSYKAHLNFYRLAQRLAAHVWAIHFGYLGYVLIDDRKKKTYLVYEGPLSEFPTPLASRCYRLPWLAYLRERMPGVLDLHKVSLANRIRCYLERMPRPVIVVGEIVLRRVILVAARWWAFRQARGIPAKITENRDFRQVVIIDARLGRPLKGWCYRLG